MMTKAEVTGMFQGRVSALLAEIENDLGRDLDDEERDSIIDDYLSELDE